MNTALANIIRPRVLIVESDGELVSQMVAVLESANVEHFVDGMRVPANESLGTNCNVASTLYELAEKDLSLYSLVICGMEFEDGTGIDALAYLRNARPSLPVILTMRDFESTLASEAIRGGALDCLIRDDLYLQHLPICVEKCLGHQRLLSESERSHERLNSSITNLIQEINQLNSTIEHLEVVATTDDLTGLNNRRYLDDMLQSIWDACTSDGRTLAFLMIDIDHFKTLNDRLGHQPGDALLFMLSRVLRENCRQSDIIARYGGDEFCVLMPDVSVEESMEIARRIAEAFNKAAAGFTAQGIEVGLSIGVAHVDQCMPVHASQMVSHADEAMYTAKRSGISVMSRGIERITDPFAEETSEQQQRRTSDSTE